MSSLDTVIIGAGPSGMTAAIYAKRKGLSLAIVADSVGGQMGKTGVIENYPGFDAVRGSDLARQMRDQMKRLEVEPLMDRVTGIGRSETGFVVATQGGRKLETRSVVLASGAHWREIGVPGEREFVNRGVSYCTTCDAPLYAGMDVAVVGGANAAAEAVIELSGIAAKVYMVVRSRLKCDQIITSRIRGYKNVTVIEGYDVARIEGKDFVESMTLRPTKGGEETKLQVGGVFVEIGQDPNSAFVKGLVRTNPKGEIEIDDYCRTSVEGIFACGDVTTVPQKQVIVAAGEGAKAAMSVFTFLSGLDKAGAPSCPI